ncbi:hypothetical protein ACFPYI_12355 [Halomarina salina]|uniref:Uncharacterized protein n=1 Tax=Halomarina salina TaxID=1872699 RepID=A0ABD5RNQ3_9EURY|nr:hypothetical protein [Halomarina salina]
MGTAYRPSSRFLRILAGDGDRTPHPPLPRETFREHPNEETVGHGVVSSLGGLGLYEAGGTTGDTSRDQLLVEASIDVLRLSRISMLYVERYVFDDRRDASRTDE